MNASVPRGLMATAVLVLPLFAASPADAQQIRRDGQVWAPEVEEIIDRLARGEPTGTFINRAFREEYLHEESGRTVHGAYDRYTDEERIRLLNALEAAARGELAGETDLTRNVSQRKAFNVLRSLAVSDRAIGIDVEDAARRMLGIYRDDREGRATSRALGTLAYLLPLSPPQAPEIRALLEREARGEGRVMQVAAIRDLLRACEEGMAILRRVHREGHIRDPVEHAWISRILEEEDSREQMERKRARPCPGG